MLAGNVSKVVCMSRVRLNEPVFEELESRILLTGSPMPESGDSVAVSANLSSENSADAESYVKEILFLDENVKNYEQLLEGLNRNVEVLLRAY